METHGRASSGLRLRSRLRIIPAVCGLAAAGILVSRLLLAQGPERPQQLPPLEGPGAAPGAVGAPRGLPGSPFVFGSITGGDLANGLIVVGTQAGGQNIRVTNGTRFVTQHSVPVSSLRINDQVSVQGVPTAISASLLTAGELPRELREGAFPSSGVRASGIAGRPSVPIREAPAAQASATAAGRVTALSPLTISVSDGVSIVLKLHAASRLIRVETMPAAQLKVGDIVVAAGQVGNDGVFTATTVGVNLRPESGIGPIGQPPVGAVPGGVQPGGAPVRPAGEGSRANPNFPGPGPNGGGAPGAPSVR